MIVEFLMYTSIPRLLYLVSSNRASKWHEFFRDYLWLPKKSLALRQQSTDNANPKQLWISGLLLLLLVYVMEQAFLHSGFLFIWCMKSSWCQEKLIIFFYLNTNNDIHIRRFGCKGSTCPTNLCRELCRGSALKKTRKEYLIKLSTLRPSYFSEASLTLCF